jgi:hypothetical protein
LIRKIRTAAQLHAENVAFGALRPIATLVKPSQPPDTTLVPEGQVAVIRHEDR